ncbi:MAG TPA: hypothetical protein VJ927_09205 [Actinomycetota bacterium]|nr:hypothetical protein [Actinomycetota bacterium]
MQVQTAFSIPLEEEWLDASDAGALAQALKCLITELVGWGTEPSEVQVPVMS